MLNAKNFGLAAGTLWGIGLFVMTLISIPTGYGADFLNVIAGIYPGYGVTVMGSFLGLVYGFADCFVGGWLFALLYNRLTRNRQGGTS